MIPLVEAVAGSFKTTDMVLPLLLADVTDDTARARTRSGDGPSIAWEVGHLLEYRCQVLGFLGVTRERPFPHDFTAKGATDGHDYPAIADMRSAWDQLKAELAAALDSAGEESMRRAMTPDAAAGTPSLLDALVGFAWHEAYHVGALMSIRKSLGLPGLRELGEKAAT